MTEGPGETTEAVAAFEQRHPGAAVGALEGSAQPGQATSHHDDMPAARHAVPLIRARAATAAFSLPDNDIRPRNTPAGSR